MNSVFNNFLNETFSIDNLQRGILEFPREMPGFLIVFISAILFFMSARRLAAFANILAAIGIFCMGLFSTGYSVMLVWLFIFSLGQHLFIPLNTSIGMEFARGGKTGRRLGQQNGAMNLAAIAGSLLIFLGFKFFSFNFTISFILSAAGLLAAATLLYSLAPDKPTTMKSRFTMRKEYGLFYWLNILFGTRKQIFITFAPWVLVTVFQQETQMVATLLVIGGIIGIFFNPLLGQAVDRFGERFVLMSEACVLIFVCIGYGFSRDIFPETISLYIVFICFILDQLLMNVSMARATYLKKIAVRPEDVHQTLMMGTSIDHVFSIAIALASGILWVNLGYQYVFLLGAVIAAANLYSASHIKTIKTVERSGSESLSSSD